MAYDPNKDYMEEMRRMAAEGNEEGFNSAQASRNEKIGATGSGYARTNYTMNDFASQNGIRPTPAISGVPANPYPGRKWSPDINYSQEMWDDIDNGNLAGAMYKERMHNAKDGDLGLGYGASGLFNYQDWEGLGGRREAKYNEIEDYFKNGFNYDYTTDPVYESILEGKTKQGNKAYQDMLAQYSTAFDGDIPVNMLNKAATTRSEIIDQADSYIPILRQMAENMHYNKGNQLINQYNMLDAQEQNAYNRQMADRNFFAEGAINDYSNRINKEAMEYQKEQDQNNLDYQKRYELMNIANMYLSLNPGMSVDEALRRAQALNFVN